MRITRTIAALALAASTLLLAPPAHAAPAATSAAAKTYRGDGDDLIRVRATKTRGIIVAKYSGESNFIVYGLDKRGKEGQVLVNEIDRYSGTVVYNGSPGDVLAGLKVEASGPWTLTFKPLSSAPLWKGSTARGTGDRVLRLAPPSRGFRSVRARHWGEGNFIVYGHATVTGFPSVLFNEIDSYSGRTTLPSGTRYVVVQADGRWTMKRR